MMLLAIAVTSGLLFLHPYILYPATLRWFRPRPIVRRPDQPQASATMVFCAYNEAPSMPEKIANFRAIKALVPGIQFKAYVDFSTDDTAAILQNHADLIDVHVATERTGKALGMRRLAAASDTEVMIFTDANVVVEPESVPRMLNYFTDRSVGGVCGTLVYVNPGDSATTVVNSAYWRLEETIKKRESASGSTMGADGSIFATRRAYYPEVPSHLLDDFIVSMSIVFAGLRLVSAPDVIAYEKAAAASTDEFRRKRRIACRAYASHRHIAPHVARLPLGERYKYVSHRFIRWYGALWAGISVVAGVLWICSLLGAVAALIAAALVGGGLWLALTAKRGPLAKIAELLRAIWATMLGVADAWQGKRYQTWQPPQSR